MKKFLIFLVSIIVAICLGMTFYYFAKDEEVIKIQTSTLYLNIGDSVSLDDLGFSHTHKKQETKINFNAGGEAVTSVISYDKSLKKYIATEKGGATTIVISTNNKKFKKFYINVVIGNGSEETPFQIKSEEDLFNIGTSRFMNIENPDAHYILMNDINLTNKHDALGKNEDGSFSAFEGTLDGNYYIINDLQINENIYGGLFAKVGEKACVKNLYLKNSKLEGAYSYAGTLAGVLAGYVDRVAIIDSTINNTSTNESYTGALAGKIATENSQTTELINIATVLRVSIESSNGNSFVRGNSYVGGISGKIDDAIVEGIKVATTVHATSNSKYCGGFAGYLSLSDEGYVRESYSLSSLNTSAQYSGALFGYIHISDTATVSLNNVLLGLYYDNSLSNITKSYQSTNNISIPTNLTTVNGLSQSDMLLAGNYIYYYSDPSDPASAKYWNDSIWKRMDGQYPILRYTDYAVPSNISISESSKDNTTSNDDQGTQNPDTPIDTPDLPTTNNGVVEISSATSLINTTFLSDYTYKLTADIDLGGITWTGKKLPKGATFDGSGKTISNFKIARGTNYVGFFSSVVGSIVKGLTIENAQLDVPQSFDYAGIMAGVIDNGSMLNVTVKNSTINYSGASVSNFAGGLVGYCSKRSALIHSATLTGISISGNIKYVGGLAGYLGQNTVLSDSKIEANSISGNIFVGGLVGQNDGLIAGCKANVTINNTYSTNETSYVGGLVGANCNEINTYKNDTTNATTASEATIKIIVSNTSASHLYFIGGIAGYNRNSNTINGCNVMGGENSVEISSNAGIVNIGGLVGLNAGKVTNSVTKMTSFGSEVNNVITAGLICQNIKGQVVGCLNMSNLFGNEIGGLVGVNTDGGILSECAIGTNSNRVNLKGKVIAGLAYYSASGEIKDCYANITTTTTSLDGLSVGAVLYFPVNSNNAQDYCTISHCIVSCEFAGLGNDNRYLVTPSNILSSKTRSTGTLVNCIFDTSPNGASDAILPSGKTAKAVSKSSYTCANSTSVTLLSASQNGFNISNNVTTTWYYDANRTTLPLLSRFVNY